MKTDVILLPGLHGSTALYDALVASAPPWARCRALPLPDDGAQGFDAIAERLAPALRPLEGFVLLAESFSGPVAARLTRMLAGRVGLLVLCNPLTVAPLRPPARLTARLIRSGLAPAWAVAFAMCGSDAALGRLILRETRRLPLPTLQARLATALRASGADITDHVAAPLLAILGTNDRLLPAATSRSLLSAVPNSRIAELPAPHLVAQTMPSAVWAAITAEFAGAT